MSNIDEIFTKDQLKEIIDSNTPTLVDFYATWCGPCKMQTPILHEFKEELGNKVNIVKVDVDQNPELASEYAVQSIPTLIMFKNGELKEKMVGLTTKATLSEMLIKLL
jgi:thioredoxin 1